MNKPNKSSLMDTLALTGTLLFAACGQTSAAQTDQNETFAHFSTADLELLFDAQTPFQQNAKQPAFIALSKNEMATTEGAHWAASNGLLMVARTRLLEKQGASTQ